MTKEHEPIEPRVPTDAELEALLDEESDVEFGETEVDAASSEQRAVLKDWSAQDFANIYTRFRPHLERHARRFLRNQSQVDEVVQDAFLYLMVTLPELDSELGVLRFLKWKVRLLCLDVIRASGRAQLSDIDAHPEFEADGPAVGSNLEQAEDAAIVRLALSKLNPRHREVLLASMYEEKSTREIAEQVGLSENATLQLMHRARAAFKKALVGELDTAGMTMSQILSVAARKAAAEAKKVGAQAMVFVLFLMLGVGAFFSFGRNSDTQQIAEQRPAVESPASEAAPAPSASASAEASKPAATTKPQQNSGSAFVAQPVIASFEIEPAPSASPISNDGINKIYDSSNSEVVFARAAVPNTQLGVNALSAYRVVASQGLYSDFKFDYDAASQFSAIELAYFIDGVTYFAYPDQTEVVSGVDAEGFEHVVYYGKVSAFFDRKGKVYEDKRLTSGTVRLEVVIAKDRSGIVKMNLDVIRG
jgi:RNA polymerase sigma-70 factor (ECF subfamily)